MKSHFGPYLTCSRSTCHQILTEGSLGRGLSINLKKSWAVWTWDVCECVTLATTMQKYAFDLNFWTKTLKMMILVSRSMFLSSRNPMVSFCFNLWPWTIKVMTFVKSLFEPYNAHSVAKFEYKIAWVRAFQRIKRYLERFERVTHANALPCPSLCKQTFLTITFELKHVGWRFWCLDLRFWSQGTRWCHLFLPMTLTFQSYDLCEITFLAISQLSMGKMLPTFNTRQDYLKIGSGPFNKSRNILSYLNMRRTRTC